MALAPRLTLEAGLGSATGEALGMQMQGTLGTIARSTTSYGLLEYGTMVGPVAVAGQIGVGVLHLEFDQSHSLLRRANMMTSSSWAITGSRAVPTGRVGVGVSQPVAIESARFHYQVPVGRTPAGQVLYADHPVDFKPTTRETDLAVFYAGVPGPLGGAVTISTEWRINRAHMRGSDSVELAAEWRLRL